MPAKSAVPCRLKVTYHSWDEAHLMLVDCRIKAALRGSTKRRERRAYYCGEHNGWHLTSQQTERGRG